MYLELEHLQGIENVAILFFKLTAVTSVNTFFGKKKYSEKKHITKMCLECTVYIFTSQSPRNT